MKGISISHLLQTIKSMPELSRTGLPRFCKEELLRFHPIHHSLLLYFANVRSLDCLYGCSRIVLFNFCEKNLAAAAMPCCEVCLPLAERSWDCNGCFPPLFPQLLNPWLAALLGLHEQLLDVVLQTKLSLCMGSGKSTVH